jgi:hypothetical protein
VPGDWASLSPSRRSGRGPCPQSNWNHMPGSGIHGRNTRRWPARRTPSWLVRGRSRRPLRTLETREIQPSPGRANHGWLRGKVPTPRRSRRTGAKSWFCAMKRRDSTPARG